MTLYICSECGYGNSSWMGRCPNCDSWNSLTIKDTNKIKATSPLNIINLNTINKSLSIRTPSALREINRVLGEGFIAGEVILLSGEPGVGKSTLLLQSLQKLPTLYISGEESSHQIKKSHK